MQRFLLAWALLGASVLGAAVAAPLSPSAQAALSPSAQAQPFKDYEFADVVIRAARPTGLARAEVNAEQIRRLNSINAEDSLKYLPSVSVRKRYIGDLNGIVQLRGVSNFQTTRILVKADDYLLLSYYLQTRYYGSPRWSLVSPQEILKAQIRYGPYEAEDSGNAMGGTINFVTQQPTHRKIELDATAFVQDFSLYGDHSSPDGRRTHFGYADRFGKLSVYGFYDHQKSLSQPMIFYNSPGLAAAGPVVTGAFVDRDPQNAERYTYGDQGPDRTEIDLFKLKLGYDFGEALKLQAQLATQGRTLNSVDKKSYLHDAAGHVIWGDGNNSTADAQINGRGFNVNSANFGSSISDRHDILAGLGLKGSLEGGWDYSLGGSVYSLQDDWTKTANRSASDPLYDGSGSLSDLEGSGWDTVDLKVGKTGLGLGTLSAYVGAHYDVYTLRADNYGTSQWDSADARTWAQSTGGSTQTLAEFGQLEWAFRPDSALTVGLRRENWLAYNAYYDKPASTVSDPVRTDERLSPKASLKIGAGDWTLALGAAKAYRFPIIEELYQNAYTTTNVNVSDKDLRPEDGTQFTATLGRAGAWGSVQLTLFRDDIKDAILYQSDTTVTPSINTYINVDRALTNGVELAASRKRWLQGLWDLDGSVTFQDPRVLEDRANRAVEGNLLPLTTQFRATLINTLHLSDDLDFSLASRYFSQQFSRLDNQDVNAGTFGGNSDGLVFDLKAGLQVTPAVRASLGVDNVLSAQVYDYHPYPQRSYFVSLSGDF